MPVLAKFYGIVIRMLIDRTFGTRLHAFYGDHELIIGLNPVRAIQGDVPCWVEREALAWAKAHQDTLLPVWNLDRTLPASLARSSLSCARQA